MELCKKCNGKHDLKKACVSKNEDAKLKSLDEKAKKEGKQTIEGKTSDAQKFTGVKPKKSKKLEKEIGGMGDSRASAPKPPLADGVNNGGLGASIAAGLSGVRKSELESGMSFNDLKKNAPAPVKIKSTESITAGMSFADLKKREEDMMKIEDDANSLAAHIKDILKKIK